MTTTLLAAPGSSPEEPTEDLANRLSHLGAVLRRQAAHVETRRPAMGVEGVGPRRRLRRTVLGSITLAAILVGTGATLVATRPDPNPIVGLIADPLPERFDTIDEPTAIQVEAAQLLLSVRGTDVLAQTTRTFNTNNTAGGRIATVGGVAVAFFDPPVVAKVILPTTTVWTSRKVQLSVTTRAEPARTLDIVGALVEASSTGQFIDTNDVRVIATWKAPSPLGVWLGERTGGGYPSFPSVGPAALRPRILAAQYGGSARMEYRDGFVWQPASTVGRTVRALRLDEATRLAKRWDAQLSATLGPGQWTALGPGVDFAIVDGQTSCLRVKTIVACDRHVFSRLISGDWYLAPLNTKGGRVSPPRRIPDGVERVVESSVTIDRPRW